MGKVANNVVLVTGKSTLLLSKSFFPLHHPNYVFLSIILTNKKIFIFTFKQSVHFFKINLNFKIQVPKNIILELVLHCK